MNLTKQTKALGESTVISAVPFYPPQILRGLARYAVRASAVRGLRCNFLSHGADKRTKGKMKEEQTDVKNMLNLKQQQQ
jgi:hypothetical protein